MKHVSDEKASTKEIDKLIGALVESLPAGYEAAHAMALDATQQLKKAFATAFQERLNAYLATVPQESLEQKRTLATRINDDLRCIGLTIRFPGTEYLAFVTADTPRAGSDSHSRFRLEGRDEQRRKMRTHGSSRIETLELMPDISRRVGRTHDTDRGVSR